MGGRGRVGFTKENGYFKVTANLHLRDMRQAVAFLRIANAFEASANRLEATGRGGKR